LDLSKKELQLGPCSRLYLNLSFPPYFFDFPRGDFSLNRNILYGEKTQLFFQIFLKNISQNMAKLPHPKKQTNNQVKLKVKLFVGAPSKIVDGMVCWWMLVHCGPVLRKVAQPLVMCLWLGITSCYIGLHNKLLGYATCLLTISP
jgi:hypothetical protein